MSDRQSVLGWLLPTVGYIVTLGFVGVTVKLALRTITWEQLVLWVPVAYGVFAVGFVVFKGTSLPFGAGGGWAIATAFLAASALVLFFYALTKGPATSVVPVGSAYPVVTLLGSVAFLSERFTPTRVIGTILVVAGVAVISR